MLERRFSWCRPPPWSGCASYRRWVVLCALTQAASLTPLALGGAVGTLSIYAIFSAVALYWGAGMGASTAWTAWAEHLVPRRVRVGYFARRSLLAQLAVLCGIIGGGALLQLGQTGQARLLAFSALFCVACASRVTSGLLLAAQPEVEPATVRRMGLREWLRSTCEGPGGRLLLLMLAMQLSVHLAASYFTPYMLERLCLSYAEYAILTAALFVARITVMQVVGWRARRIGA